MRGGAAVLAAALAGCGPKAPARDWRPAGAEEADLVYFVLVDRFANGDPENDGAVDPDDPMAFHGGDIQGVIAHLDHLEALGVRTVWLSPVFATRAEPIGRWGAYHGYWVRDLTRIEPRFGGEAALRELSRALHERGMRLVLDLVLNHTDYDAPLRAEHPDWFHPAVDIEDWDDPEQRVNRQVHGLPDLAQEKPEVAAYLVDAAVERARRSGVDGYRIDAVRHMPIGFLADLNDALDAAFDGGFWTVGEDFDGGASRLAGTWRAGHFDAMFDFPLRYAMVDVFCRDEPVGRLAGTLSLDRLYPDPNQLLTFLDNHDLPRIIEECGGLPHRVDQALAFLFATRGIPTITYGTEALMMGAEEPANRGDMPWDAPHPAGYETPIPGLQELRELHPALRAGRTGVLSLSDTHATFLRATPDEAAVIVVNRGRERVMEQLPDEVWGAAHVVRILSAPEREGISVSTFEEPWFLGETKGRVFAEPRSLEVVILRADEAGGFAALADRLAHPEAATVTVRAEGAPPGRVVLAGAGPELGAWNPHEGLEIPEEGASFTVPAGTVVNAKLVVLGDHGQATWEPGPDRAFLVPAGGGAWTLRFGER